MVATANSDSTQTQQIVLESVQNIQNVTQLHEYLLQALNSSDKIDIDDLHFEVLFTPGHSPDEISLYGHGVLYSGDTLFNAGIGRTDFPGCSYKQLESSIKTKLYTLPDSTVVYPGHGPATTIGDEKRGNPFIR